MPMFALDSTSDGEVSLQLFISRGRPGPHLRDAYCYLMVASPHLHGGVILSVGGVLHGILVWQSVMGLSYVGLAFGPEFG